MRILSFLFLIIWILLFPVIAGVVSYTSDDHSYYYLGLISIACIFNFVWFILSMDYQEMNLITKVGNLLVLNLPAYFFIKKYFIQKKHQISQKDQTDHRYVFESTNDGDQQKVQVENFELDFTEVELQQLAKQQTRRNHQVLKNNSSKEQSNQIVEEHRKIIWGFCVYLLLLIYQKEPSLTSTYQLLQAYKASIDDVSVLCENIVDFAKRDDLVLFIPDYKLNNDVQMVLNETPSEEFKVALKQDRIDMQIRAKIILASLNKDK